MNKLPRRKVLLGLAGVAGSAVLGRTPARAAPATPGKPTPLIRTYVAGAAHHASRDAVARLRPGESLTLRRAPDNAYDPRTVELLTRDGQLLGHVPRIDNQALSNLMDAGIPVSANVTSITGDPAQPEIHVQANVHWTA